MGILDEAIREHLDLKRQHGADDSELKQLEDEAFGSPGRPGDGEAADPAAEAPTEFLVQPGADEGEERAAEPAEPVGRRELTEIQEPPAASPEEDDEPAEEESPAAEHEAVPDAKSSPGSHTTAERHAIADQPTQHFDVEEELGPPAAEASEQAEVEADSPETEVEDVEEEEDDFFDEQRLSDELDQALEAPLETDEAPSEELEPEPEPEPESEEVEVEEADEAPVTSHREEEEDVLEETPDFLEESPDDDQLWFEQKPPKDFDFDD